MFKKLVVFWVFFFHLLPISAQDLKILTIVLSELPKMEQSKLGLFLAGDFNNWHPQNKAHQFQINKQFQFQLTLSLPVSMVNFKVTKGSWEKVECGGNGKGINNRKFQLNKDTTIYLNIAAFSDQFEKAIIKSTVSKNVHILDSGFYMPQLGVKRKIWIYLPSSYHDKKKRYPVIYMHDGQNLFDKATSGYGEWGVDEILNSIAIVDNKQSIIVGINHGGDERLLEYNPFDSRFGKGKGDAYVDFIVKTLKPYLDKNYRTLKALKHTGITGSSMGGLISVYAAIKYPRIFGDAGVFSPSIWIAPKLYDFIAQSKLNPKSRFYFLAGELESKEMVSDMKKIYGLLLKKGHPKNNLKFIVKADGQHSEWFWHREFVDFYKWLGDN
jgi:predicted alpha/beta superfamily hydrolase